MAARKTASKKTARKRVVRRRKRIDPERAAEALEALSGEMTPLQRARLDGAIGRTARVWGMTHSHLYETIVRMLDTFRDVKELAEQLKQRVPNAPNILRDLADMIDAARPENNGGSPPAGP